MNLYHWQRWNFWMRSLPIGVSALALTGMQVLGVASIQPFPINSLWADTQGANVKTTAQLTTVRILTPDASGSGVIVGHQGQVYTVLTNWHVVALRQQHTIMTPDGKRHTPMSRQPRQLGSNDLALTQFRSTTKYKVAPISTEPVAVGDQVFSAGFPMYRKGTLITTFDQGIRAFQFTQGEVSVLLPKSLAQGYRLGYTNDIVAGMSGGPIFNAQGFLIGINGREKPEDPAFAVYGFEDGTQPSPALLEKMVNSSWGIPIRSYLQFVSLSSCTGTNVFVGAGLGS